VRAPAADLLGGGRCDLRLEVEPQVVAGGEVDQPGVADPDAAAVDLIDDLIPQPGLLEVNDAPVGRRGFPFSVDDSVWTIIDHSASGW
jgi:hypothetical protein